ncbi:MAG: 23S rRNA (guanosine(2251)-2'-O)-methyltransferase RlmB [Acidobacteria bacterium]|jgi:23S rRNA (guanosine2251-2'-O)-methyltransferase|nr:23S rRNA (guanosine(2251)-2'-O)-methyltransferase RlmB [Acidobacteriota bacterium]
MQVLSGIHPVTEALRAGQPVERILVAKGAGGPKVQLIIDLAKQANVPVRYEPREALDRASKAASHQGVVAFTSGQRYAQFAELPATAQLLVLLDGIEDPHNLGAIIRSAHAAGADAILLPDRRAAPVTEVAAKAAAGALAHMPIVRIGNVAQTLEKLKKEGYWIYGLTEHGTELYDQVQFNVPTVLVVGGEGAGLHELVARNCDLLVKIPMYGKIGSLNVSVATGIALFEWRRRAATTH